MSGIYSQVQIPVVNAGSSSMNHSPAPRAGSPAFQANSQ